MAVLVGLEPDEVENGSGERDREGGRASEPGPDRDVRLDRDLDRGKLDGLGTEININGTFCQMAHLSGKRSLKLVNPESYKLGLSNIKFIHWAS